MSKENFEKRNVGLNLRHIKQYLIMEKQAFTEKGLIETEESLIKW